MEVFEQLEKRMEEILAELRDLRSENERLRDEIAQARAGHDEVMHRVERLLQMVQGETE